MCIQIHQTCPSCEKAFDFRRECALGVTASGPFPAESMDSAKQAQESSKSAQSAHHLLTSEPSWSFRTLQPSTDEDAPQPGAAATAASPAHHDQQEQEQEQQSPHAITTQTKTTKLCGPCLASHRARVAADARLTQQQTQHQTEQTQLQSQCKAEAKELAKELAKADSIATNNWMRAEAFKAQCNCFLDSRQDELDALHSNQQNEDMSPFAARDRIGVYAVRDRVVELKGREGIWARIRAEAEVRKRERRRVALLGAARARVERRLVGRYFPERMRRASVGNCGWKWWVGVVICFVLVLRVSFGSCGLL